VEQVDHMVREDTTAIGAVTGARAGQLPYHPTGQQLGKIMYGPASRSAGAAIGDAAEDGRMRHLTPNGGL